MGKVTLTQDEGEQNCTPLTYYATQISKYVAGISIHVERERERRDTRKKRVWGKSVERWEKTWSICLEASHQDAQKWRIPGEPSLITLSSSPFDCTSLTLPPIFLLIICTYFCGGERDGGFVSLWRRRGGESGDCVLTQTAAAAATLGERGGRPNLQSLTVHFFLISFA